MGLTLVEKIAARHADGLPVGTVVRAGDFVSIRPRHVMTHDNTGAVIPKFKQIGATRIADPAQPVFAIDHDIQNVTPKNLEKYAKIEAFAGEHGIDFYPAGTGISHQVMVEQGYVVPGALVVASDSHSNLYGAIAGVFPFDEVTVNYLRSRVGEFMSPKRPGKRGPKSRSGYTNIDVDEWWKNRSDFTADADANYAIELELDLATVVPHVSGPNEVKTMVSLPEMQRKHVPIQKAYLLSCVNARFEDLHDAAEVVRARGGKVADGVEFYLAPASAEVQAKSEKNGDWQTLLDAGAIPLPSGCGACIGLGRGVVEKGETAISATNRNFKGRMGDRDALVYLGSPAVVAASALAGFISAPKAFADRAAGTAIRRAPSKPQSAGSVEIIAGFPSSVRGRIH